MNTGNTYSGRYFNSSSTRAQLVIVRLRAGKIVIEQPDVFAEPLVWEVDSLNSIELEKNKILLRYGGLNDLQVLEISDLSFLTYLESQNPSLPRTKKTASPFRYVVASLIFLFVTLLALTYFFVIPWLENKITEHFPKNTEVQMGKVMLQSFLSGEKTDTLTSAFVNDFFQKSRIHSDYKIHITVVESPVVNAFALPGGELVVYTGILKDLKDYKELVALLGHETGHVQKRHSLKLLLKQFSLAIIVGSIFQNNNQLTSLIIQKAAALRQLSYSREAEKEADLYGYWQMKKTGTDPEGMIELFEQLETVTKEAPEPPEFLMTHPSIQNRMTNIEALRKNDRQKYFPNAHLVKIWNKITKTLPDNGHSF